MRGRQTAWLALTGFILLAAVQGMRTAKAETDQAIYTDALQNGWQNWSWCTVDLAATTPVHGGTNSIKVAYPGAFGGLFLHHDSLNGAGYSNLTFWINGGGTADRALTVQAVIGKAGQPAVQLAKYVDGGAIPADGWKKVTVPLADLGATHTKDLAGFWIMNGNAPETAFYIDDVMLTGQAHPAPDLPNAPVRIKVDAGAGMHPINPMIYGVAYGDATTLPALNCPVNRMGGNNTSRYNWKLNADNRGSDWFFESIGDNSATPGERGDSFIKASLAAGAQPMMTIPMVGYVAKLDANRGKLWSYSIAKYGAQTGHDQWNADAGSGTAAKDNKPITTNDPTDADVPADSSYQAAWVQHLVTTWGKADKGGLRYYLLDNEPSIWQGTHRDVHAVGPKMEEIRDKIIDYSARIKAIDPGALTVGPEEWGWSGYIYSGYDQQYAAAHGWTNHPDRDAHGGMDYLPWLLQQLHQHDAGKPHRSLDLFTVHYYPQGGEFGNDTSEAMQLRRNRSTRSLWDPAYVDETWVKEKVQLIPRIKGWVKQYYPGLPVGITEYNWGAEGHINGATAQADVLGIFGREGLDAAARWTTPDPKGPVFKAMQLYRNYDGKKSAFGDTSVTDNVPDPDSLSSFAAVRKADGALTLMVINKVLTGQTPVTLDISHFTGSGKAQAWQLTDSNVIQRLPDVTAAGSALSATLPAQSITLFVVEAGR